MSMSLKDTLHLLRQILSPTTGVEQRVWQRIVLKTNVSVLYDVRSLLVPSSYCRVSIWHHVRRVLSVPEISIFADIRGTVQHIRLIKWGTAFVITVLVLKLMPSFFVATPISAESRVLLFPTRGEVSLSSGEQGWRNVAEEHLLEESSIVRTRDGEATIVLHDDGVIRLAPYTAIELHDLSDRPVSLDGPTLTLIHGTIWVQGLLAPHVEPLHIAMSYGDVFLNEGSVAIEEGTTVVVSVWDRRATILHDHQRLPLVAREQTWLWEGNVPTVKRTSSAEARQLWVTQNLDRDSVHRQDIARYQQGRRLEFAGILPGSPFYSVKRVVEGIDIFLTFNKETRIRKQLQQASRRLDEAAALVMAGGEPELLLIEYEDVLKTLAGYAVDGEVFAQLIADVLQENTAAIAAAFPGEEGRLLKMAVLEAAVAAGSGGNIRIADVESVLMGEAITAFREDVRAGYTAAAYDGFLRLKPSIASVLGTVDLRADLRKELQAFLSDFALAVEKRRNVVGDIDISFYKDVAVYLPSSVQPSVILLTDEEVRDIARGIYARVLSTFTMRRSRENQLWSELEALRGHPDQARILRRLYQEFGDAPWYAAYVREEMKFLREEQGLL